MALIRTDAPLFKIHPAKVVHKQSVSLRPIEHHYEKEGEEPYIKYSCQICEGLAKAVKGFSFYDEDENDEGGRFVNISFPKGTPNCPCCGINIDWGYKEGLLGMNEIESEAEVETEIKTESDSESESESTTSAKEGVKTEILTSANTDEKLEKQNFIMECLKAEIVETELLFVQERIPKGNCPYAYYSPRKGSEGINCEIADCSDCTDIFLEIMEEEIKDKLEEMIGKWEVEFDGKKV